MGITELGMASLIMSLLLFVEKSLHINQQASTYILYNIPTFTWYKIKVVCACVYILYYIILIYIYIYIYINKRLDSTDSSSALFLFFILLRIDLAKNSDRLHVRPHLHALAIEPHPLFCK